MCPVHEYVFQHACVTQSNLHYEELNVVQEAVLPVC